MVLAAQAAFLSLPIQAEETSHVRAVHPVGSGKTMEVETSLKESEKFLPFSIGIVPPLQFPDSSWDVIGLRLNIFVGRHHNVSFLDPAGLANLVDGDLCGIQTAGIYNKIYNASAAVQVGGILNLCGHDFTGLEIGGILNKVDDTFTGLQVSCLNLSGTVAGFQTGIFNSAERAQGLQIGLVNYSRELDGLQIGLVNVIADSPVPFMPVLNFAF